MLMHQRSAFLSGWLAAIALAIPCGIASAQNDVEIGQIKVARGMVTVLRGGQAMDGAVGLRLRAQDAIKTGVDGAVGITMRDNGVLSLGPNSLLTLEQFEFDDTSHQGRFDSSLLRGTLAMTSGRLSKQSAQAVKVRTPTAVLGVRGTELLVAVEP